MSGAASRRIAKAAGGRIVAMGLAVLAALAAAVWFLPRWDSRLESIWFDSCQRLHPRQVASFPVTVVEIDEPSIAKLGQWPWPRSELAALARRIEQERPLAIGMDILKPDPDRLSPERLLDEAKRQDEVLARHLAALPSTDDVLAQAISGGPVVLGVAGTPEANQHPLLAPPFRIVDREHGPSDAVARDLLHFAGALTNLDALDRAAQGHGLISAGPVEEVIRRLPLAVRIDDRFVPSLSIEMMRVALHAPDVRLYADGPSVDSVGVGNVVVPTESDGQLRLYFSHRDAGRFVSAIDVLDGKVDPLRLRNQLVLIGATGLATVDYQNTPLGERMPGSEIHAQLLENLYDGSWLRRPSWAPALELALFCALGLLLVWATPRWKPRNAALVAIGCMLLLVAASLLAFAEKRVLFDPVAPALGLLVLFTVLLVLTLGEASRQRRDLERTVQAQRVQAAYIAGELEAARRIQTGLLPRADLLRNDRRVDLAASMTPAREVGGDLYDFFLLDDDRLFFLIGDVAGKGLSASMFMAVSKALYKSTTLRSPNATLSELMRAANDEVSRDNPEMFFVTAFAGVLDLSSGHLVYCNAGHENPYLLRAEPHGWVQITDGAGPPLCAVERFPYTGKERRLLPGEILCLLTDGVVEAQDAQGQRLGARRLQLALQTLLQGAPTARVLVDALCDEVHRFTGDAERADDVTVLAIRWIGP